MSQNLSRTGSEGANHLPCDVLLRCLHFIATDGEAAAFYRLAFLTHKNEELRLRAVKMPRPIVFHVTSNHAGHSFLFAIPFAQATIAQIEIDWGDSSEPLVVSEVGEGFAQHRYGAAGTYCVRIFPHGPGVTLHGADGQETGQTVCWLDHLGWPKVDTSRRASLRGSRMPRPQRWPLQNWNTYVKSFESWGSLGLRSLSSLFREAKFMDFALPLGDLGKVQDFSFLFYRAERFNQPIGAWDMTSATNLEAMFCGALKFDHPIGKWNVSKVTNLNDTFNCCPFNQPLDAWDVSNVVSMKKTFHFATNFNQPLGSWNVSKVTAMSNLFSHSSFDQPINRWSVGNVVDMKSMFETCPFNQPIGDWDVSNVTNMVKMFSRAPRFNQSLGNWNVGNVRNMESMFDECASFNQPIGAWDVGNVENMARMFKVALVFNQDLSTWKLGRVSIEDMFEGAKQMSNGTKSAV